MIGLDTNVIIRYLLQDDTKQTKKATKLIESFCSSESPCWLSIIVMCELTWVLRSTYNLDKQTINKIVENILLTSQFQVAQSDLVREALIKCQHSNLDFPDALIGRLNHSDGCKTTVTFDKKACHSRDFSMV
ncbi:MAG: type II toxin-antitoxin system VapC family toxin [Magnetococcales bacterium]|nr:type II toxin-antitoxin system VapC family toxin [Magnetococcales bacterium]